MTIISRSLPNDAVQMYKIVDDPLKLAEVSVFSCMQVPYMNT